MITNLDYSLMNRQGKTIILYKPLPNVTRNHDFLQQESLSNPPTISNHISVKKNIKKKKKKTQRLKWLIKRNISQTNQPLATISWMASLILSSSDLTASFMATSFGPSIPNDNRTRTFTLPMNTPDNRHVCDLELLGTTSVPWKPPWGHQKVNRWEK